MIPAGVLFLVLAVCCLFIALALPYWHEHGR